MRRRLLSTFGIFLLCGAAPPVEFVPVEPRFAGAAYEYRQLWESEGPQIVAALEAATGVVFPDAPIEVVVRQGPPMTSYDGRSIRLRANSSPAFRRATLVHELGHRLALTLPRTAELDDHRLLYLFLYDVWDDLYGREFADRMVRIERRIPGRYDYDAAWTWALAMTRDQRRARLQALVAMRRDPADAIAAKADGVPRLQYAVAAIVKAPEATPAGASAPSPATPGAAQAKPNQRAASSSPRLR